jgi:hypothetical protein
MKSTKRKPTPTRRQPVSTSRQEKTGTKEPLTLDGSTGVPDPAPSPIDLARIVDVRREMARIYRGMKGGEIDAGTGAKLVWVLSQIGSMIELEEFERRITKLEDRQRAGGPHALPSSATTH